MPLSVTEHYVSALWLEVPGSDENRVAHLYPDSAFHFSSNSTNAGHPVGALDQYSVVAEEVFDGPIKLAGTRCEHLAEIGLAEDLSLTHTIILLEYGGNIKGQNVADNPATY